jgi:hypothetical protein
MPFPLEHFLTLAVTAHDELPRVQVEFDRARMVLSSIFGKKLDTHEGKLPKDFLDVAFSNVAARSRSEHRSASRYLRAKAVPMRSGVGKPAHEFGDRDGRKTHFGAVRRHGDRVRKHHVSESTAMRDHVVDRNSHARSECWSDEDLRMFREGKLADTHLDHLNARLSDA